MVVKLVSLNLNHRTRPLPIEAKLVDRLCELQPDVLVFNEYVDQGVAREVKPLLKSVGFEHQAVSESDEYTPGRWHNQILIASKAPIEAQSVPRDGPDGMAATNTLFVTTFGISIAGVRVPAYTRATEWYAYWEWLSDGLQGDIAIGDFNADPSRPRKWDRVLETLVAHGGWSRSDIDGPWSYRGNNGSTSCVDHVLTRGRVRTKSARYVSERFVPDFTNHTALIAEVELIY